jgi:DNA-directed RNA polymerase specialized sigma24 family protein
LIQRLRQNTYGSAFELAAITGHSAGNVSVRLHRARARLARLLRNEPAGALTLVQLET